MGANGKDDDGRDESWPWNDKWLKSIKAEHEKFFADLKNEGKRLEKELRNDDDNNNTNTSPFSAFKEFVDSNFHTLTDGLKNFPSNIAELRAKMQREQERLQREELDISRRWTGSDDSPDHIQLELLRSTQDERRDALDATSALLEEAQRRNANIPPAKIEALFKDPENMLGYLDRLASPMLALGGAWYYMPETGDKLPTADSWRWLSPQQRWLSVDWFKRSPYSPMRLEAHPDLGLYGAKWRAAFEDLMDASLDKPMSSMERVGVRALHGRPQSTYYGPGLDWLLSLQCRGILPPLLPRAHNDIESKGDLRQSEASSILDVISRRKTDLALTGESCIGWHTSLYKDVSDLMSEVATKATSDTEFEVTELPPYSPATEADLYEPANFVDQLEAQKAQDSFNSLVKVNNEEQQEQDESDMFLWESMFEALNQNDVETATEVLNEWYSLHGNVRGLVDDEWMRMLVLNEALRKSDLPEKDMHKNFAFLREFTPCEQQDDKIALKRRDRRLELMDRAEILAGKRLEWPPLSDEELEEFVERLEQESENLEQMVGNRSEVRSTTPKKPEVLSALTTTETTRLPDGTITTKVVLKKRFTDGREETSESVHTSNENLEQQHQRQQADEDKAKNKGWFWS